MCRNRTQLTACPKPITGRASAQHGGHGGEQPGIPNQRVEVPPAEGKAQRRKQAEEPEGELRVSAECVFQYPLQQRLYGKEDESEQKFKEEIHVLDEKYGGGLWFCRT